MSEAEQRLEDPAFRELLARRSRLRWGLTGTLLGAYLAYGLAGLYAADALAAPFMGSAVTWGIVLGYAIILLAIGLSIYYVGAVNRLIAPLQARLGSGEE